MSQENVNVVSKVIKGWAAGRPAIDLISPDYVLDFSTAPGAWPEQQVYRGRDEFVQFLLTWAETWEEWRYDVEEMLDAGDQVVVVGRHILIAKGTNASIEARWAYVNTVRDGVIARTDVHLSRASALDAAGLRE
jgi:ketosteroid isomerase-like protein